MIDDITKAQTRINELPDGEVKTFTEYQSAAVEACRKLVNSSHDMTTKVSSNPSEIVLSSREVTLNYGKLADATQGALATIESDEVKYSL